MNRFAFLAISSLTIALTAQQPMARFDVASVKPVKTTMYSFTFPPGGGFRSTLPLEWLIGLAYDIHPLARITGEPSWIRTEWFEIDARPAGTATQHETLAMLRSLLEDRFRLRHRKDPTAKDMVWALVMAHDDRRLGPAIRASSCEKIAGAIRQVRG